MAWPIKVARKAPAIPSTVVRMNPPGLFGPGESNRAIIPATNPTRMTQRMPLISVAPFFESRVLKKPVLCEAQVSASRPNSNPGRQLAFARQPPVRRQMIDHVWQLPAEPGEQIIARQAG